VADTIEIGDDIFADVGENGEILGIEIWNASKNIIEPDSHTNRRNYRKTQKRGALLEKFRMNLEALLRDEMLVQSELTSPNVEEIANLLLIATRRRENERNIASTTLINSF